MITILDYGMGNIGSMANMIKKAGSEAIITNDIKEIEKAKKLIIPGVGAFDNGMTKLKEQNFIEVLNYKVLEEKIPVLGVCLGMQLFTNSSEEGKLKGLGWIDAETIKFTSEKIGKLRIPHMGWNTINARKDKILYEDMYEDTAFYFVHSYYVKCKNDEDIAATTNYGIEFTSSIQHGNIFATQFHPEKSHKFGLKLMKNFAELV